MKNHAVQYVPVDEVRPAPQVRERFDQDSLLALAMTLKSVGMRQPISVRRVVGGYEIILGERRWRAAKLAGMAEVPVLVEDRDLSEAETLELQLVENIAREDLNPVEKATALDRLMKATGWSAAEVARRTGCSPAGVSKLTSLLLLEPDVLARVRDRQIPYSTAYALVRIADATEQRRLSEEAMTQGLSRESVLARTKAVAAKRAPGFSPRRPSVRRQRVVIPLGGGRSVTVCAPSLSVESVLTWLTDLLERMKVASADGSALDDVVSAVSGTRR